MDVHEFDEMNEATIKGWEDRDGALADGTPLRDVVADMPVEVRFAGSVTWFPAIVVSVTDWEIPQIIVEIPPIRDSFHVPTNFCRKRRYE